VAIEHAEQTETHAAPPHGEHHRRKGLMEALLARCCGLDVHKASVAACVRGPGPDGAPEQLVRTFGTTTPELLALHDWLQAHGVTHVAMESTGVYWKPVYSVLEATFTVLLVNAAPIEQVPGRKTDVSDCAWIAQLRAHGLLRGSFVPPVMIRELRDLKTQIQERTRELNRLHKVLQDANLKLSSVATDVLGVSGRAMREALIHGSTDADVLAELARGKLRKKLPALRQALTGRFRSHHAFLLGQILAHLQYLDEAIADLSGRIAEVLRPFEAVVQRLLTIPGVQRRTAEVVLAETGLDMSQFPSAGQLSRTVSGQSRECRQTAQRQDPQRQQVVAHGVHRSRDRCGPYQDNRPGGILPSPHAPARP